MPLPVFEPDIICIQVRSLLLNSYYQKSRYPLVRPSGHLTVLTENFRCFSQSLQANAKSVCTKQGTDDSKVQFFLLVVSSSRQTPRRYCLSQAQNVSSIRPSNDPIKTRHVQQLQQQNLQIRYTRILSQNVIIIYQLAIANYGFYLVII